MTAQSVLLFEDTSFLITPHLVCSQRPCNARDTDTTPPIPPLSQEPSCALLMLVLCSRSTMNTIPREATLITGIRTQDNDTNVVSGVVGVAGWSPLPFPVSTAGALFSSSSSRFRSEAYISASPGSSESSMFTGPSPSPPSVALRLMTPTLPLPKCLLLML